MNKDFFSFAFSTFYHTFNMYIKHGQRNTSESLTSTKLRWEDPFKKYTDSYLFQALA